MKYFVTDNLEVLTSGQAMSAGHVVPGHAHRHDHATFVHAGGFRCDELEFQGGPVVRSTTIWADSGSPFVEIKAGVFHTLTALVDGSRYACIHACHNDRGELTVKRTGWETAENVHERLCITN